MGKNYTISAMSYSLAIVHIPKFQLLPAVCTDCKSGSLLPRRTVRDLFRSVTAADLTHLPSYLCSVRQRGSMYGVARKREWELPELQGWRLNWELCDAGIFVGERKFGWKIWWEWE